MALRLIELIVPSDLAPRVREELSSLAVETPWHETIGDGRIIVRILLDAEDTGHVVDTLDDRFGRETGYQLLLLPVVAALPRRPDEPPSEPTMESRPVAGGLSREELYHDVRDMTQLSRVYVATVILSVAVAAVGMIRENVAVIIGAMVIAPLLGPNVSLAFATTVGDVPLMRRSIATNLVGVFISLLLTIALGAIMTIDPSVGEIAQRTQVGLSDIVLALAAGGVGALAMTRGIPSTLVGVMVAVALLPPTVALGLMLGSGHWSLAGGAGLLLATNIICINLAGVLAFGAQGIRPRAWWEAARAKRSARVAVALWCTLLAVLIALIVIAAGK